MTINDAVIKATVAKISSYVREFEKEIREDQIEKDAKIIDIMKDGDEPYAIKNATASMEYGIRCEILECASEEIRDQFKEIAVEKFSEKTAKAFGGCQKCCGKGYATQRYDEIGCADFGSDGFENKGLNRIITCTSCDRGKDLAKILNTKDEYIKSLEAKISSIEPCPHCKKELECDCLSDNNNIYDQSNNR